MTDADLDEWADHDPPAPSPSPPASNVQEPAATYYPHVEAFVTQHLAVSYRRKVDGRTVTWCPKWWLHAEAISRLEALWRAWEHLRLDPALGMSVWWRDHADHHMTVLLDPNGPFRGCSPDKGHGNRAQTLPTDAPPAGWFSNPRVTEPDSGRG